MNKKTHFVIIAGESSGDIHGAQIMKNLRYQNPNISFSGLGGPKMAKEGFSSLVSINRLAIMGFCEVLKNICWNPIGPTYLFIPGLIGAPPTSRNDSCHQAC